MTKQPFKISPIALMLDMFGMILIAFAGYEFYLRKKTGNGILSEIISWPHAPWLLMLLGLLLMVPFHKQIFQAYKIAKQQQIEAQKRNKPDF